LILINLSEVPTRYELGGEGLPGKYRDLFSGASVSLPARLTGTAAAWEYKVFVSGPNAVRFLDSLAALPLVTASWEPIPSDVPFAPCPTPVTYPTPTSDRIPYHAACAAGTDALDSDWCPLTRLVLGTNPAAVTARFKASWDIEKLFVQVEVNDAAPFGNLATPWDNSSVELFLDMEHKADGVFGSGDFQYIFTFNHLDPFEKFDRIAGVTCSTTRTAETWSVQAAIPWSTLGAKPSSQAIYGFDVGVDIDEDGSVRHGQLMWHGTADNYNNTSQYSDLILLPCSRIKKR
jgi:hypothetical protein